MHLIEPLGFDLDDKHLRRAGLDYHELVKINLYKNMEEFLLSQNPIRIFACSTKGKNIYTKTEFQKGDYFLFGPETSGLPSEILDNFNYDKIIRIPMMQNSRSLNLSNAVAVILYEALRQNKFLF